MCAEWAFRHFRRPIILMLGLCMIASALEQPRPTHVSPAEEESHLLLRNYPPIPPDAQKLGISGTVILEVAISPSGDVESVRVISGHPMLAQPAVEAVRGWKYKPFVENGVPLEVTAEVGVGFIPDVAAAQRRFAAQRRLGILLLLGLYGLIATAWVRRSRDRNRQSHWRSTLFLIGLLVLSLSLANLSAELIYRFVTGHKLGITPAIGIWVNVNAMACLVAGIFCLVGKGRGRFVSFLAMPLLIFFWGIHFAV
jgi:TonB family protein